jgi:hypothetical protein
MKKICTIRGQNGEKRPTEPRNEIWGPQSLWSFDLFIVREIYMEQKKHTFGGEKAKIGPQSPKTDFRAHNQNGRVIYLSFGNFTWRKEKYSFGGKKAKISFKSSKTR